MKDMSNEEYLRQAGVAQRNDVQDILSILNSYGENRWWLSDDPRTRAYYQTIDESGRLLLPWAQYHRDTETLLGREVFTSEFGSSGYTTLRQEVERAWIYGVGVTSERERVERVQSAVEQARHLAQQYGKQFEIIDPDQQE